MKTSAVVFPILEGKTEAWRQFMREISGPRFAAFSESRRKAGLHERTFLQHTPMGDMVIVTLEGEHPEESFGQMVSASDPFTIWFREQVKLLHGVDLASLPKGAPSEQVIDSERIAVAAM
jgi:hypothetical protein